MAATSLVARVHEMHSTLVRVTRVRDGAAQRKRARQIILEDARTAPSANVSNVGGWQSRPDYLMEQEELRGLLYPQIFDAAVGYLALVDAPQTYDLRITGWANVNGRRHSNAVHEHLDQDWALSGVLYLSDGADATCSLRFVDPRAFHIRDASHIRDGLHVSDAAVSAAANPPSQAAETAATAVREGVEAAEGVATAEEGGVELAAAAHEESD